MSAGSIIGTIHSLSLDTCVNILIHLPFTLSGLIAGLSISVFSKPLTLLIGLLIVGVQTAESYGIHVVPYKRMQDYFTNIDMRSAVQDNMAFKISFGALFALSAFAEF